MTKELKDVSAYILRGNPFHNGHAAVLRKALSTSKLVVVLIGSSGKARSLKNPFTFAERKSMIERWYTTEFGLSPNAPALKIMALQDYPYSNSTWIQSVQSLVKRAVTAFCVERTRDGIPTILTDIYLTGSDRDDSTWYLSSFPQWKLDLIAPVDPHLDLSATSVRKVLYESNLFASDFAALELKVPRSTRQFLQAFAGTGGLETLRREYKYIKMYKDSWKAAPYAPTFVCADAVVIQSGHVLVVERGAEPGKGLWALPGGFVKQNQRMEDAAIDELMEETGIRLAEGKKGEEITKSMLRGSIKGKEIFDDPERSARGRTITMAYLFRLDDEKPLPKVKGMNVPLHESGGEVIVETAKAWWIPLDQALSQTDKWFEDHNDILKIMKDQKDV